MSKYRTVIAVSYDIEAENREEAEEVALKQFQEELASYGMGGAGGDEPSAFFGVNTEQVNDALG